MPSFIIGLLINLGSTPVYHVEYSQQAAIIDHYFDIHQDAYARYMKQCLSYDTQPSVNLDAETVRNYCTWYHDEMKSLNDYIKAFTD